MSEAVRYFEDKTLARCTTCSERDGKDIFEPTEFVEANVCEHEYRELLKRKKGADYTWFIFVYLILFLGFQIISFITSQSSSANAGLIVISFEFIYLLCIPLLLIMTRDRTKTLFDANNPELLEMEAALIKARKKRKDST